MPLMVDKIDDESHLRSCRNLYPFWIKINFGSETKEVSRIMRSREQQGWIRVVFGYSREGQ